MRSPKPLEALVLRGAHLRNLGIGRLPQIVDSVDDGFVPFQGKLIDARDLGFQIGIGFAQLFEVGIDAGAGPLQILDQIEAMGDIGTDIVQPGAESLARLGHLGDAPPHFLIDDLDRILVAQDVAPHQIDFAFRAFDRFPELMSGDGVAVTHRLQVLQRGADLIESPVVGAGVIGLAARYLQQLADMRLQGADRPHRIFQPLVHIGDLLARAVFVDRAGSGRNLAFLTRLLDQDPVFGASRLPSA